MTWEMSNGVDCRKTVETGRNWVGQRQRLPGRLVFIDLETAGQQSWRPIMQIAAIAIDGRGRTLEVFEAKLQFNERHATKRALSRRHYNRRQWYREARPPREVALRFRQFLIRHAVPGGYSAEGKRIWQARIVAHNAAFDGPFLRKWFERHQLHFPADYRFYCTLQRALWLFQERPDLRPPSDFKLGTLCQYFGLSLHPDEAHDALADVRATVELHREFFRSSR